MGTGEGSLGTGRGVCRDRRFCPSDNKRKKEINNGSSEPRRGRKDAERKPPTDCEGSSNGKMTQVR